jgi:hypothetical protein
VGTIVLLSSAPNFAQDTLWWYLAQRSSLCTAAPRSSTTGSSASQSQIRRILSTARLVTIIQSTSRRAQWTLTLLGFVFGQSDAVLTRNVAEVAVHGDGIIRRRQRKFAATDLPTSGGDAGAPLLVLRRCTGVCQQVEV